MAGIGLSTARPILLGISQLFEIELSRSDKRGGGCSACRRTGGVQQGWSGRGPRPAAVADGWWPLNGSDNEAVVNMPHPVTEQRGDNPQAIDRHDAVIERYRRGQLSHRQVGEALGLDYWQTEAYLRERGVLLKYSAADLEADEAALKRISRES